jgi:hypothetical protein
MEIIDALGLITMGIFLISMSAIFLAIAIGIVVVL